MLFWHLLISAVQKGFNALGFSEYIGSVPVTLNMELMTAMPFGQRKTAIRDNINQQRIDLKWVLPKLSNQMLSDAKGLQKQLGERNIKLTFIIFTN